MAYGIESARPEPGDGVAPHGGWAQPVHSGGDGASTQETDLLDPWSPLALRGHVPGTRTSVPLPALRQAPRRAQRCALELSAARGTALGNRLLGGALIFHVIWCRTEYIRSKIMPSDAPAQCLFNCSTVLAWYTATTAMQPVPNVCLRICDAALFGCRRLSHQLGKSRLALSEVNCFFECASHTGNDGTTVVLHKSTVVVCSATTSVVKPCHDR